jgi:hypothetical protein
MNQMIERLGKLWNTEMGVGAAVILVAVIVGAAGALIGGWFGWTIANGQKPSLVRSAAVDERSGSVRLAVDGVSIWVKAPEGAVEYDVSTDGAKFYRVGSEGRFLSSDKP